MLSALLDLFFPKRSLTGQEGSWITPEELRALRRTQPLRLHKPLLRNEGIRFLDCLIAGGQYSSSHLLKKAIQTYKYGRIRELHIPLSMLILEALPGLYFPQRRRGRNPHGIQCSIFNPPPREARLVPQSPQGGVERAEWGRFSHPVLCPVPLHWVRRFQRGFNQALLLAEDIADAREWPLAELLTRRRATGHQAWRLRGERLRALDGAFRYTGPSPAPRFVMLVDDLATTGATLDACAKTLKEAGVKRVEALVVARG